MMNYVLSFCKITAASRIFSRNFYLPLLKPITPKDALRTFRITGKWLLGSKTQHYIPVLLNHKDKRSTKVEDYGQVVHELMDGYNYMIPILDPGNENHRLLLEILNSKEGQGNFVYTVDDKKCNIILTAPLELAIRDGEVIDVMVSQRNDKILVKMANFKKVPIEMQCFSEENGPLFNGEGATSPEEEKCHHHGKFTMSIAKIFEDKEREAEEWELELKRIMSRKRKQHGEGTKEWNEMIKITIRNLNWNKFEKEAKKVVDQITEPVVEQHIGMEIEDLEKTRKVPEVVTSYGLDILPLMGEIPDVVNSMSGAKLHEIEAEIEEDAEIDPETEEMIKKTMKRRVSGVKVTLSSGKECFVSGQMVKTEDGDVFVPGQTIENEFGLEYLPGFTVNMDNKPTLIKGLIMGDEDHQQKPMFLPTESAITADGQLTFTTTKEERIKYKPKKRPFKIKKKKAAKNKVEAQEESVEAQENNLTLETVEETPKKIAKKKKKKAKKEEEDVIVEETSVPPTPVIEINLEELLADYITEKEQLDEPVFEERRPREEDESSSLAQRLEFEQLLKELLDDGMDDLLASIEDKKATLQQKLEELRKLKMAAGNSAVTYANFEHAQDLVSKVTTDYEDSARMSEMLLTLVRRVATIRDRKSIHPENIHSSIEITSFATDAEEKLYSCSDKLKVAVKSIAVAANDGFKKRSKDQVYALNALSKIFVEVMQDDKIKNEFSNIIKTPLERNDICTAILKELTQPVAKSKVEILKEMIKDNNAHESDDVILEKLCQIVEKEGDVLGSAFSRLCKTDSELLEKVVDLLKGKSGRIKTESAAVEALQDAVVVVVLQYSENCLTEVNENYDCESVAEFLEEASCLAKALGANDAAESLAQMALDPDVELFECDRQCLSILKRYCLIKKLADRDYSLKTAIYRLKQNPERSRSDSRIRQLVRESAVLITQASPLKSSKELPLQFLKTENLLAVEDFLAQRIKMDQPILISKKGLQAIIPNEAARGVLAGRVPYILVDEVGISNFKPMHMLSALKNRELHYEDVGVGARSERDRSQSPFLTTSRGSSPQMTTDIKSRIRKPFNKSRMVA